jgi:hypothetical protein
MLQFGGKPNKSSSSDSKRHFAVIMGGKEHGRYVSSTPSSAAKKAVTKLCASNKSKKVEFHIRETTQGSKKKTYGPYSGYIEKLKEPIELKGRVIKYKPVAKLSGKLSVKKGGGPLDDLKIFGNAMTISFQMSEKLSGWLSSNLRSLTLLLKCCQYPISRATGLNSAFVQNKQAIGHTDNSWAVTN